MREPISIAGAIGGILTTGVALLAVLWPDRLSPGAQAAIIAFGNSVILTGALLWARLRSTPTAAPVLEAGQPVSTPGSAVPDAVVTPVSPERVERVSEALSAPPSP